MEGETLFGSDLSKAIVTSKLCTLGAGWVWGEGSPETLTPTPTPRGQVWRGD